MFFNFTNLLKKHDLLESSLNNKTAKEQGIFLNFFYLNYIKLIPFISENLIGAPIITVDVENAHRWLQLCSSPCKQK
jgi:hypothetical protein